MSAPTKQVKRAYEGPRLSKYLPYFMLGVGALEAILFVVGVS